MPPKAALTEALSARREYLAGKGAFRVSRLAIFFFCSASEAFGFLMWWY